jgi:hypothetical protein
MDLHSPIVLNRQASHETRQHTLDFGRPIFNLCCLASRQEAEIGDQDCEIFEQIPYRRASRYLPRY